MRLKIAVSVVRFRPWAPFRVVTLSTVKSGIAHWKTFRGANYPRRAHSPHPTGNGINSRASSRHCLSASATDASGNYALRICHRNEHREGQVGGAYRRLARVPALNARKNGQISLSSAVRAAPGAGSRPPSRLSCRKAGKVPLFAPGRESYGVSRLRGGLYPKSDSHRYVGRKRRRLLQSA
jgi:hypothetical protein